MRATPLAATRRRRPAPSRAGRRRRSRPAPSPPRASRRAAAPPRTRARPGARTAGSAATPCPGRSAGEEQAFAAEQRGLDLAHVLDVEARRRRCRRPRSRCRPAASRPACSSRRTTVPPACTKARPSPSSFCMMKPSPPKKPADSFCWKRDAQRHAARRAQEGVLLADQRAAQLAQVHRQDLAGVGRGEGHALLAAGRWLV